MSEHYFTSKPSVESDAATWSFTLRGKPFVFTSDRGVFSKGEVDFGSKLLIEEFQFSAQTGDILDVGCGYGPIGISLAQEAPEKQVYMVDVNERALELAKMNAEKNGADNVEVIQSYLFDDVNKTDFGVIVTNPPIRAGKQVVHRLFEQAYDHLAKGGQLWVVIRKQQGAPSAIDKLKAIYNEVDIVAKKKGYYILRAEKV